MPRKVIDMIRRYRYGNPVSTPAVVRSLPVTDGCPEEVQVQISAPSVVFTRTLEKDDMVFGLGEQLRGMNKRGHTYVSFNTDDGVHSEEKQSLYGAHNFLLIAGKTCLGLFLDDPGEVIMDIGETDYARMQLRSVNGNLNLYIITGTDAMDICHQFRQLIGQSYVPPFWGMGYIQSRWGYASDKAIREVVRIHREKDIPLDGVCLDIDYMDHFAAFTYDPKAFPDLKGLCTDLDAEHIKVIPIMDAAIGYDHDSVPRNEGLEKGYFVLREDGTPFLAAVWPGMCVFPDFLRPEVRSWYGKLFHPLLDAGISGFWLDMNEPSIFYTQRGLQAAWDASDQLRNMKLEPDDIWRVKGLFYDMSMNRTDFASFYHEVDGQKVRHDQVHNLYGAGMTMATSQGMQDYRPGERFLLFSRSSYIGSHRFAGIWQGDNKSWWSHILMNLKMMPSLNMCGYLFTGADLGGFGDNTTEDLLLRWLELGIYTPLMRNHSALHTREQEIYRFSCWEDMRNILTVRYALIPYLYSLIMQSALNADLMFRPLAFDYPRDEIARHIEDQVMLGPDCMIAPVYEQNAVGRPVYLPEDMLFVRFRSAWDYDCIPMKKGAHYVMLALNEAALFIRRNALLPLCTARVRSTEDLDLEHFRLLGWVTDRAESALYTDNGHSLPESADARTFHFRVRLSENKLVSDSDLPADLSGICTDAEAEA